MTEDEDVRRVIAAAVGPAPWYWTTFPTYRLGDRRFVWRVEQDDRAPRPRLIEEGTTEPLLVVDIYTRAVVANPGCLAIWYPRGAAGSIEVAAWRLSSLSPPPGVRFEGPPTGQTDRVPYRAASPPDERVSIPDRLPPGANQGPTATLLDEVPELFLLAGGPPVADSGSARRRRRSTSGTRAMAGSRFSPRPGSRPAPTTSVTSGSPALPATRRPAAWSAAGSGSPTSSSTNPAHASCGRCRRPPPRVDGRSQRI
jgi:hypothetical protein